MSKLSHAHIINVVGRYSIALALLYKGWAANVVSDTLAADPMELWLALGLAWLLMDWSPPKAGEEAQ